MAPGEPWIVDIALELVKIREALEQLAMTLSDIYDTL